MSISMDELSKRYDILSEGEVILDVRTPDEFAEGHVPGAINIPHEEVAARFDEIKDYKKIYIHCRSGNRVKQCRAMLSGFEGPELVYITCSGMMDWESSGNPIES